MHSGYVCNGSPAHIAGAPVRCFPRALLSQIASVCDSCLCLPPPPRTPPASMGKVVRKSATKAKELGEFRSPRPRIRADSRS